jgi:hypothetical protein
MVLSCMWGPGRLMLVQPGYCIFVWEEILTCLNYSSTPIHSFSICELLVCIQKINSTKYHWIIWSTCRVIPIYLKNRDSSGYGRLRVDKKWIAHKNLTQLSSVPKKRKRHTIEFSHQFGVVLLALSVWRHHDPLSDHESTSKILYQHVTSIWNLLLLAKAVDNFPTNLVRYIAILICYEWQWTCHHLETRSYTSTIWPRRHRVCLIMPLW